MEEDMGQSKLSTGSWVMIVVGVVMLALGVGFDVDARSVSRQYDQITALVDDNARTVKLNSTAVSDLRAATATNTADISALAGQIGDLKSSIGDLKGLLEAHILGTKERTP